MYLAIIQPCPVFIMHSLYHFFVRQSFTRVLVMSILLSFTCKGYASSVLPLSLTQISQQANIIFYAKVLANRVEKDKRSGQIVTYTDFQIIQSIKGQVTGKYTIKQLGGRLPGANYYLRVYGVPVFKKNGEYVVFLPAVSQLGFCSPLGLYQGSFAVATINGEKIISNGRDYSPSSYSNTKQAQIPSQQSRSLAINSPRSTSTPPVISMPLATNPNHPAQARLDDFIQTVRARFLK